MPERRSSSFAHQVIQIHPAAPPKPPMGAACNGCGVCCLAEPCPVGMLISLRRTGACKAVVWVESEHQYRCGLLTWGNPEVVNEAKQWPVGQKVGVTPQLFVTSLLRPLWQWWARRIISAGSGCDASLDVIREDP